MLVTVGKLRRAANCGHHRRGDHGADSPDLLQPLGDRIHFCNQRDSDVQFLESLMYG